MSRPLATLLEEAAPGLLRRRDPAPLPLARIEAVIFDMDGVLVEIKGSFREVISRTVQFFFNELLQVPGEELLVSGDDTALFKLAGRFNNDWDLANGAVAWGLLKYLGRDGNGVSMRELRHEAPTLEEFTAEVKRRGGGLVPVMELVRKRLGVKAFHRFADLYRPELVKQIFMEHYAGPEYCRRFYHFEPRYYHGPGLMRNERYVIELELLERLAAHGVGLGVLTGRIPEEADFLLRQTGLDRLIDQAHVVTDDGALPPKPSPAGLAALAERMGFSGAIYVGDTPDDWTTVAAYRMLDGGRPPFAGCLVRQTGALPTELMERYFQEARPDYLAEDVNCLLRALLAARA